MMSKYLSKGNIHLPLLCYNENKDECGCGGEVNSIVQVILSNTYSSTTRTTISLLLARLKQDYDATKLSISRKYGISCTPLSML